jgi:hypothetical protein
MLEFALIEGKLSQGYKMDPKALVMVLEIVLTFVPLK